MKSRLNPQTASPEAFNAMMSLEMSVRGLGLEKSLHGLVKIRASQINGCAYCINMHASDARAIGETEERIFLLDAWRDSPLYTDRERAALAWTEALTLVAQTHAPDEDYEELRRHFTEEETVNLGLLIATINAWNRLMIGARRIHPVQHAAT